MKAEIPPKYQQQTEAARKAHVAAWKKSGLSKSKYCFQKGLSLSTFSGWCEKLESQGEKASIAKFIPVTVKTSKQDVQPLRKLEVAFGNGVKVSLPEVKDVRACLMMLREL